MTYHKVDMTVSLILMVVVGAIDVLLWGFIIADGNHVFSYYPYLLSALFLAVINACHFIYCLISGWFNKDNQDTDFYPRTKSEAIIPFGGFHPFDQSSPREHAVAKIILKWLLAGPSIYLQQAIAAWLKDKRTDY